MEHTSGLILIVWKCIYLGSIEENVFLKKPLALLASAAHIWKNL